MVNIQAKKPAKRYAKALFELLENENEQKVLSEIRVFLDFIESDIGFKNFMHHPNISAKDKKEIVKEAFSGFSDVTFRFLSILIDEDRINCLDEIESRLIQDINNKNKILPVDVFLAISPTDDIKKIITEKLEAKFKSKVKLNFIKDETILGGMIIKVFDTSIDLSINKKLENFNRM